jgi:hypothetical protein
VVLFRNVYIRIRNSINKKKRIVSIHKANNELGPMNLKIKTLKFKLQHQNDQNTSDVPMKTVKINRNIDRDDWVNNRTLFNSLTPVSPSSLKSPVSQVSSMVSPASHMSPILSPVTQVPSILDLTIKPKRAKHAIKSHKRIITTAGVIKSTNNQ